MDRRLIFHAGWLIALLVLTSATPALGAASPGPVYLPLILRPTVPAGCVPGLSNSPTWTGSAVNVQPSNRMGQSFTTIGSRLCDVDVSILTAGPGQGGDSLTLSVLSDAGALLATASQVVAEGYDGWLRFQLPGGGVGVTPGQNVVIMLEDTGKGVFNWRYARDAYAGGSSIFFGSPRTRNDFFFRINF